MTAAALFDRLSLRLRQRELSSHDQLAAAARAHVRGEKIDETKLEQALIDTRQDVSVFEQLCDLERQRLERFNAIELAASARSKVEKIDAALDNEHRKFTELREAYELRVGKLREDRREPAAAVDAADRAKAWLLNRHNVGGAIGVEYADAMEKQQQAAVAIEDLERTIRNSREEIRLCNSWVEEVRSSWDRVIADSGMPAVRKKGEPVTRPMPADMVEKVENYERRKSRHQDRLQEAERELEAAKVAMSAADARVAAVQKKILKP
jgi:hypothetical protein